MQYNGFTVVPVYTIVVELWII